MGFYKDLALKEMAIEDDLLDRWASIRPNTTSKSDHTGVDYADFYRESENLFSLSELIILRDRLIYMSFPDFTDMGLSDDDLAWRASNEDWIGDVEHLILIKSEFAKGIKP